MMLIGLTPVNSAYAQKKIKKTPVDIVSKPVQTKVVSTNSTHFKPNPAMDQFIGDLMSKMTLDEKLGQLNLPSADDFTTGQAKSSNIGQKIKEGRVGGLFNIKGVDKIREMQRVAIEESRLKIPLIFGMDVIHGYETTFPIPLGLASSWDMELIKRSAQIAAQEATADGINWTFSPMVDIARDPRWGRVAEGSGEDAYLGSQIAKAMVYGYQGNDLSASNTMLACVKHFALYGAAEAGRDYNTVDMSRVRMYNEYLTPYKAAVDAGAGSVMVSFNEIDGIPATGNKWLLTDLLRNQWQFPGFVVTDYTGINEMIAHGMGDLQQVSKLALNAGVDMDMVGEGFLTTLTKSLKEGQVSYSAIDAAVRRILEAKYRLGLFEDPYKYCDANRAKTEIFSNQHRTEARSIAAQSMVLMKNENNVLPLKASGTVAVIGPLADNPENMPGTWSVAAKHAKAVSMLKGLKETLGDKVNFVTAKGANFDYDAQFESRISMFGKNSYRDNRPKEEILKEAVEVARKADVIVAALGETAEMSGESSSRSNIEVPQSQKDLLVELKKLGKPIVLVLFTGRPLVLNDESKLADAILNVWFAGSEAGYAISDVIFGKVNPSGKLPMTFPRNVGQVPIYYNHKSTGRPENKEDQFDKFRSVYLDVPNSPLFPFGYGLSYTTFSYGDINLSNTQLQGNQTLKASISVTNTGKYDGAEVVQLFIRDVVGSNTRPVKELKGFRKVMLKAGESKTVSFDITPEELKYYNNDLKYDWESGDFEIMIGTNSHDVKSVTINWQK
ncbi:MAG TPA: beta-glucosidase BglX [Paludibacteraceae bacterium]|nr:beta-glucosidase BglX [Paludibacteraceae bacterium]HPT43241.1 beta-glucosidase BglX [Paludibacteraceae bacterium]